MFNTKFCLLVIFLLILFIIIFQFIIFRNKLIDNFKTLQTFYINRFLLEIDYGTIDIIIDEIILSLLKLHYFIINS